MSESSTAVPLGPPVRPGTLNAWVNESRTSPLGSRARPAIAADARPTSLPSKTSVHWPVDVFQAATSSFCTIPAPSGTATAPSKLIHSSPVAVATQLSVASLHAPAGHGGVPALQLPSWLQVGVPLQNSPSSTQSALLRHVTQRSSDSRQRLVHGDEPGLQLPAASQISTPLQNWPSEQCELITQSTQRSSASLQKSAGVHGAPPGSHAPPAQSSTPLQNSVSTQS